MVGENAAFAGAEGYGSVDAPAVILKDLTLTELHFCGIRGLQVKATARVVVQQTALESVYHVFGWKIGPINAAEACLAVAADGAICEVDGKHHVAQEHPQRLVVPDLAGFCNHA